MSGKPILSYAAAALILAAGTILPVAAQAMQAVNLRCEYAANPLGIDAVRPRLSWTLASKRRGERQTAYQILVADSPNALKRNQGDFWDSGKVASDESAQIDYAGKPLASRQRVWWKVRVWDRDGKPSAYTAPRWWEAGLLKPEDWKGNWIGRLGNAADRPDLSGVSWVWYPEGDPIREAPANATRYFRAVLDVPANRPMASATLYVVGDDSFQAWVNGAEVGNGASWQTWSAFPIANHLKPGRNVIALAVHNEASAAGLAALTTLTYSDGGTHRLTTGANWRTSDAAPANWIQAGFDAANWKPAKVLAALGDGPWGQIATPASRPQSPPYLRRMFWLNRPIRQARLYISAKGLYLPFVNGSRIGHDVLRPGWTDYKKRIPYQTYDVTNALHIGRNAVGMILGDGWYSGYVGFGGRRNHYGTQPQGLAQLEVEYDNGTRETVATDAAWKASDGAIRSSDLLMGETYDARHNTTDWSLAAFDDQSWKPASASPIEPSPLLVAQTGPTAQAVEEIHPRTIKNVKGAWIFDLGQNMVGWARLRVHGPSGTTVRLRFAEMLNPDGSVYTTNLRGARATDQYTLRGDEKPEVFEPSFTFHGFRYVEVTGFPGKPGKGAITGVVISSATEPTGTFACSSPLVNQLQHNIVWGQRGNYLEVPTDCPQRDERLGWMGDAQIFVRTGCFNFDIAGFMTKWMRDVEDAQSPQGGFSDVSPRLVDPSDGAPAWGDAGIIVPWTIYQCYGDTQIVREHWDAMAKWLDYIRSANPDLIWRKRANNNFGDWLNVGNDTPRDVLGTAYFAYDASLMARMARAIGRDTEAQTYEQLFTDIRAAFNREFVSADGKIKGDTQTAYVLALRFNLLPENLRPIVANRLVGHIQERGNHLATGFVGVGYLTPTLTDTGHLDTAYTLLNNDTYPSWGYSIRQGATTIWERWDGYTDTKGFQDPGMNSFNHYSLGSVGEWLYADVAGIGLDPTAPGYKHIVLRPRPGGGLTFARSAYDSMHGRIESAWKIDKGGFAYEVLVPANTNATVYVPAANVDAVREGNRPAAQSEGVRFLRMENGSAVYEVGSGRYHFTAR